MRAVVLLVCSEGPDLENSFEKEKTKVEKVHRGMWNYLLNIVPNVLKQSN